MKVYLALDIGTTSVKGCAFDETFRRIASINEEYALEVPQEHYVEVAPDVYWTAVCNGIQNMLKQGIKACDIASVTFTTQGETMIPVDREGHPLSKAIVWLDDRAREEAAILGEKVDNDTFYHMTGVPELTAAVPTAKLLWHVRQASHIHGQVYKYLLLEDFLIQRMTGRFVTEWSLLSSTGYYDIVNRRYWSEMLAWCGVAEDKLPEVVPSGTRVGGVSDQAAVQTGLCAGTPVIAGAMDQVCAAIGAGNVTEGIVAENTGTCQAVSVTTKLPLFDEARCVPVYTHFDDRYMLLAYNPTAAVVLKWFKDTFMAEFRETLPEGANVYDAMTSLAAEVPVLSGGVTVIPHFSGRLFPEPDEDMRGAFVGLGLGTSRGHCIRAIMESIAYMLRQSLECLAKMGIKPEEIRSVGGASVSKLWNQIKSSVNRLPIYAMQESESTALGAAMLGAWILSLQRNSPLDEPKQHRGESICKEMVAQERKLRYNETASQT